MKKIFVLFWLVILLTAISRQSFSQTSLYVSSGDNFFISAATPVFIDGFAMNPSADYKIPGINSVTRNTTATPPPPGTYIQRVFQFAQTSDPYNGDIIFYYQDAELNGLDENSLNLKIYNGSAWNTYTPTRDATNNFVTASALSSVAINQATLSGSFPLPVTLTRFWGEENNCTALLKWSTATEQNSKEFQVQQSSNGVSFSTVGIVPAAGNSSVVKNYQLSVPLVNALNYFRLRMVDNDGTSKYSSILNISTTCANNKITVQPNPAVQSITVKGLSGFNQVVLLNQAGQQIEVLTTANNTAEFNLSTLPAGTYVIQIVKEGRTVESIKVIKK